MTAPNGAYRVYQAGGLTELDGVPPEVAKQLRVIVTELQDIAAAIRKPSYRKVTANYTATPQDDFIECEPTGNITVTLPLPARVKNMEVTIKNVTAHTITIGATVDGAANPTIASQWHARTLYSNGTAWRFRSTYP